jgi:hypothetical protein
LLRSKADHFTISEIAKGKNKNGEDIVSGDFIFEVKGAPLGDAQASQKITIPREKVIDSEKAASQIADLLFNEYVVGNSIENAEIKAQLLGKVVWFRSCAIPEISKHPLKYLMKLFQTACKLDILVSIF